MDLALQMESNRVIYTQNLCIGSCQFQQGDRQLLSSEVWTAHSSTES